MTVHPPSLPHPLAERRAELPVFARATHPHSCSLGARPHASRRQARRHLDEWKARGPGPGHVGPLPHFYHVAEDHQAMMEAFCHG